MPAGREGWAVCSAPAAGSRRCAVIDDMIAEDDRVAVRLTTSARQTGTFMGIQPSGNRYTIDEIHIFRVRDGQ